MASKRNIRAGKAFVELFADDSKLVRGLRRAERRVKAFGRRIGTFGRKLVALGAAFVAPIALATRVFAGFDDQMRAVQAVLGATAKQFDMLTEKAKLLGRTTSFTAAQVAGAMLELGRAGFDSKQIDASISSVLSLARATGTELPAAANIAAGTLRAFGLEAEQMGHVADVMTATANNSAQTLEELAEAMKYAAPVADAYGLTLEETSKIIGSLANFMIKGSMAGTTIKNIMLQLASPDIRAKLAALGVATTDAAGGMLEVSAVLRKLGNSIRSMPKADQLAIMKDLFGKRAVAGGIKLTAASFDRLGKAIDNAGGTAKRTAGIMDKGIGGVLRRLWSAVEGISIGIGEALAPALSDMGNWLSRVAGKITAWINNNQELIVMLMKVVGIVTATGVALIALGLVISMLGSALGLLVTVVTSVGTVFALLAGVLAFILTPIGAVITAIAALGTYLVYATGAGGKALTWLGEKFNTLKNDALAAFRGIADALMAGDIGLAAKILWLSLKAVWLKGTSSLRAMWANMWHGIAALAEGAVHGLTKAFINAVSVWQKVLAETKGFFADTFTFLKMAAKEVGASIQGAFDESFDVSAAVDKIRLEAHEGFERNESERDKTLRAADELHQVLTRRNDQVHKRNMGIIDKEHQTKLSAIDKELVRTKKALQDAIEAARKQRQAVDADKGPGKLLAPQDIIAKANRALAGLGSLLAGQATKMSVRGTFSVARLTGLAAGDVDSRIAQYTKETAKNTKEVVKVLKTGGAVFA